MAEDDLRSELKQRLDTRAKAFVSDPDLITDPVLDLAIDEALELAGITSPMPVLTDIAYHRMKLQLGMGIDEVDFKVYRTALAQITDPDSPNAPTKAKSQQRPNPYQ